MIPAISLLVLAACLLAYAVGYRCGRTDEQLEQR